MMNSRFTYPVHAFAEDSMEFSPGSPSVGLGMHHTSGSDLKALLKNTIKVKKQRKKKWYSKEKAREGDKPKRPLSGYNLFFRDKRKQLLEALPDRDGAKPRRTHGKICFKELATRISGMWNTLDEQNKSYYQALGQEEREKYYVELEKYKARQRAIEQATVPSSTMNVETTSVPSRTGILNSPLPSSDPLEPLCLSQSPTNTSELTKRLDPEQMSHLLHLFS
eukprot:scaffold34664_cov240-Amphora_coffeaeformis.AAC.7